MIRGSRTPEQEEAPSGEKKRGDRVRRSSFYDTPPGSQRLLSGVTHSFQRIEEIASKRPRRWPMLLTGAFSLLLSFLLYLGFETQEERFIQRLIDEEGRGLAALIERDFFLRETALTRMADRLAASPVHLLTGWAGDAQNYLHDFPGYERIGWCRSPEEIHWVTPEGGGHRPFEKIRPTEHTSLLEALQRIEERRKPSARLLPKLAEGEFALLHLVPIVSGDRYLGTLLTLSSLSPWIDTVFSEISPAYGISLHAGGMEIYRRIPAAPKERFLWEGPLSLGMDPAWRLRVVPNRTFVSQNRSGLPIFALFFGIVISGMMMLVFHLKESGRLRTTQFETTNRFLFEEIEKRRTAQSRYEDSTAFLEAIVENVPLMIFVKEAENLHFVLFNRAGVELTGISQEEILGKTDHDFFPPEEAEFFIAKDREVLAGKDVLVIEEEPLHTRHRGVRLLRTRKVPIRDASGKPKFLLGVSEDITERKTRDREREKQRRALERSNAELEQFAYVASHDLQEPLRTVASYADLLEERAGECLDEKTHHFIRRIREAIHRMHALVEDLLVYSRVDRTDRIIEPVSIAEVVERVKVGLHRSIEESGARIIAGDLPQIDGSFTLLVQLFQNLLSNAVKFRREIPPEIEITSRRGEQGNWIFSIRDNGIGIAPEHQEQIFMIFRRLHPTSQYPGTGIGLAICRRIVEWHGGQIWVVSKENEGSTFSFTLPARQDRVALEIGKGSSPLP